MPKKSRKKRKTKEEVSEVSPPPARPTQALIQPQVTQPIALPPEKVQRLQQLVAELIVLGGELGMEIATLECKELLSCPVVKKAREIVVKVKAIREELKVE